MKLQLPWIGKAAGSSAGQILQSYWGHTYSRSFPSMFHYPNTKLQQECQAKFFDIQRIWQPIYVVIRQHIGSTQRTNLGIYFDGATAEIGISDSELSVGSRKPLNLSVQR